MMNPKVFLVCAGTALMLANSVFAGEGIWTNNGEIVCNAGGNQDRPAVTTDGSGGALVVWQENYDIYAQRLDSAGARMWTCGDQGMVVCNAGGYQEHPVITTDGSSGALVVWTDMGCDIYAQRLDSAGIRVWTCANQGMLVCNAGGGGQYYSAITTDGNGGALVVWANVMEDSGIYAQRLDSAGARMWAAQGMVVCNDGGVSAITTDGSGGAFVVWGGSGNGRDIYAQRLDSAGARMWTCGEQGIVVCNASGHQDDPAITTDGSSGALVVWVDKSGSDYDIYAQRLDSAGARVWTRGEQGMAVCNAEGYQRYPAVTTDGIGGALVVWKGNGIRAQKLTSAGARVWTCSDQGMAVCDSGQDMYSPVITTDSSNGAIVVWWEHRTADVDIYAQRIIRPRPQITSISPNSSPWGETANVTLHGCSFLDDRGQVTYVKLTPASGDGNVIEGQDLSISSPVAFTCNFNLGGLSTASSKYVVMYDSLGQTGTSDTELFYVSPPNQELSWTSVPGNVYTGTQDNLAGQINYKAAGHDYLSSLKVINQGTAEAGTDIGKIDLWHKTGGGSSGIFDPAAAARLKSFVPGASGEWNISFGNEELRVDNGDALYITVDIWGGARLGRTCRFSLPPLGAKFQYGGSLPDVEKKNAYEQIIVRYVNFYLDFQSTAPVNTSKGQQGVRLGRIKLQEATGTCQEVTSVLIALYDKAMTEQDLGAVFKRVWLEQGSARRAELTWPFSGSRFILSAPLSVPGQTETEWDLAGDYQADTHIKSYFMGLPHEQCINEGKTLADPVPGREFPLLGGQINIRSQELESSFSNYPNPFQAGRESTRISYYLKGQARVDIQVMTLTGRLVKQLEKADKGVGMHETAWDGRNENGHWVRSGVYLLRIKVSYSGGGKEQLVRKVAVVR